MSFSAVKAGQAYIDIIVRDNQLVKGLNSASIKLQSFGASISGIGAKIAGTGLLFSAPFVSAAKSFVTAADGLDDLSQKTGISVESLSKLEFAAELSGASLESVVKSTVKLQKSLASAADGNQAAQKTFKDLGLDFKSLINLSPEDSFAEVADAISKIQNPTLRTGVAMEVFGKNAVELGEILAKGKTNLSDWYAEAERLGIVISSDAASAAAELKDQIFILGKQFTNLAGSIFIDEIKELAKYLKETAGAAAGFIKQNKEIILLVAKVAVGVALVGGAIVAVGVLFSSLGAIIGGFLSVLGTVGAVFSGIISVIGFLVSPIGLVIVALGALTTWFLTCTQTGQTLISNLISSFQQFSSEVTTSFTAIVEALRAGEIEAAWQVVTSFMSLQWTKFIGLLKTQWAEWKGFFLKIWNTVTSTFQTGWETAVDNAANVTLNLWSALRVGWVETVAFLQKGWVGFVQVIRTVWNKVSSWIGETLASALESLGLVEEGTAATVAKMGKDKQKEIDTTAAQSSADIEVNRARARVSIDEEHSGIASGLQDEHKRRQDEIDKAQIAEDERIKNATQAVIDEQEKMINEAQNAWKSAVESAKNAGKELTNPLGDTAPDVKKDLMGGIDTTVEAAGAGDQGKSKGIFNINALDSLLGKGDRIPEKQLSALELSNKLLQEISQNGALFGV